MIYVYTYLNIKPAGAPSSRGFSRSSPGAIVYTVSRRWLPALPTSELLAAQPPVRSSMFWIIRIVSIFIYLVVTARLDYFTQFEPCQLRKREIPRKTTWPPASRTRWSGLPEPLLFAFDKYRNMSGGTTNLIRRYVHPAMSQIWLGIRWLRVFLVRACHFVRFAVLRLKYENQS